MKELAKSMVLGVPIGLIGGILIWMIFRLIVLILQ
jgi:hypothetical protein